MTKRVEIPHLKILYSLISASSNRNGMRDRGDRYQFQAAFISRQSMG
ncbi:hypothetical protein [Nostoc sp.]